MTNEPLNYERPFVFYLHPWELDPGQPRLPGRWLSRWRHSVNLSRTATKLDRLLERFQFGRPRDVLDDLEPELPRLTVDQLIGGDHRPSAAPVEVGA